MFCINYPGWSNLWWQHKGNCQKCVWVWALQDFLVQIGPWSPHFSLKISHFLLYGLEIDFNIQKIKIKKEIDFNIKEICILPPMIYSPWLVEISIKSSLPMPLSYPCCYFPLSSITIHPKPKELSFFDLSNYSLALLELTLKLSLLCL